MKIRSWTGEMVDVRDRMTVLFRGEQFVIEGHVTIHPENADALFFRGLWNDATACTMLKCPFRVGDEIEFFHNGEWVYGHHMTDYSMGLLAEKPEMDGTVYRHYNQNLRTSPEIEHE